MKLDVSDLIEQGLVKAKDYPNGLKILKYAKKVFYDNLWHLDDRLLECRGTVVDQNWNVVVSPFRKVFNYGENGTTVDPKKLVEIIRKVNGFMFCVTKTDKYGIIYSTTGSLDSDYVDMGKEILKDFKPTAFDATYIFEINHPNDPHIIDEDVGATLIGLRDTYSGWLATEGLLDHISPAQGLKRPWVNERIHFEEVLEQSKEFQYEGWMVRDRDTGEVLCKLKTPYYLTKKFFMRVSKKKLDRIFDNTDNFRKNVEEEYYPLIDFITTNWTKESWAVMSEQNRGKVVEDFLNGQ